MTVPDYDGASHRHYCAARGSARGLGSLVPGTVRESLVTARSAPFFPGKNDDLHIYRERFKFISHMGQGYLLQLKDYKIGRRAQGGFMGSRSEKEREEGGGKGAVNERGRKGRTSQYKWEISLPLKEVMAITDLEEAR